MKGNSLLQGVEHMLMSLPLVCTPLTPAPVLQYKDGLVAHLDAVLQQYIAAHHLQPLRLFITGAPAAGKSDMAARYRYHDLLNDRHIAVSHALLTSQTVATIRFVLAEVPTLLSCQV